MKLRVSGKLVFGVGFNDADYSITKYEKIDGKNKLVWSCPYYIRWQGMLARCYYQKNLNRNSTYIGCSVATEWHKFSTFKAWMEQQDWQGKELDKDLLVAGNKIYSPETCLFIDSNINKFLTERTALRGSLPIGVSFHKTASKYQAECRSVLTGKRTYLGLFDSIKDAHGAWLSFKLEQARVLASEQTNEVIANALIFRYENYTSEPEEK